MPQRAIIVGGGPIGSRVATILGDHGHDPVVIEQDTDERDQGHRSRHGFRIHGDATQPGIIEQADPAQADVFAALTSDAETNHALCERVATRVGSTRTVARGAVSGETEAVDAAADETVHPTTAGAKAVASAVLGYDQHICPVPTSGFDLVEVGVDPRAPAANRALSTVGFPSGSQVIAETEGMRIAGPATELRPDRQYLVAVEPRAADTVRNLLRGIQ